MYQFKYKKYKHKYLKLKRLVAGSTDSSSEELVNNIDTIKALFPHLDDDSKYAKLQIDRPSITYISYQRNADYTTKLLLQVLPPNVDPKDLVITDGTGGTGGNTLSFAKTFKKVYSIELDSKRAGYLQNNVNVYGFNNVTVINGDTVDEIKKITDHDIICIDPPWGGSSYKEHKYLRLHMSNIGIEDLCLQIFDDKIMQKVPQIICLKLPTNYDTKYLHSKLSGDHKIKYIKLKKMLIVFVFF